MEKKERTELSNRLVLEFGATGDNDTTSISCNLDKLLDILEQELDKAREEGFTIDELKFIRNYIATLIPRQKDLTSDGWKMRGDILSKLSKLNKEEK